VEIQEPVSSADSGIAAARSSPFSAARGSPVSRALLLPLAFGAVYLIWGSTYLAIRIAVESIPPFLMAGTRFVLAGGLLYLGLRVSGVRAPTRAERGHAGLAGVLMLTLGNGAVTWAEENGVASNLAALLVAAVPLDIALLDWLRPGGRRPARHVLLGIAVGFGGMVLLVIPDHAAVTAPGGRRAGAVLAILLGGVGWAVGSLYARYGVRHRHTTMASAQHMLMAGATLLLIGVAHGEARPGHLALAAITGKSVLAFAYLTIFGSLVAFSAYGWLLVVSTPAKLSTAAYVNPVIAVILGWLVLHEALTRRALLGAALIILAVAVMTFGGKGRRTIAALRARR
jgi:drug/metabolite transporter (DMT)-like permease